MTYRCRLPPARWLAVLLLCVAAPLQAALRIELHAQLPALDAAQVRASEQLIDDVLARVPPAIAAESSLVLQLRWRDDLPAHVQGRAHGRELGLDRSLLQPLLQAGPADSVAAAQALQQARAALIHELAHALDRSPDGGWSAQPRFLDLAGWQQRPLWPGRGRNNFSLRSPDRYELDSPAEFFAVNLEHYLLDPDYACRRPLLHAWFAQNLGAPGQLGAAQCPPALPFMQAGEQEGLAELLALDPARVYQVDYLLAEGNEKLMSRWGHSMLRLVICAPGRTPGPACRMDLRHHLVLSFRAFVGDVQISSWRGLTGAYPSRLFVLPLSQVIEEYTKVELRGVSSTPLRLQPEEITSLLQQAARLHWDYDGRYYFISNNCAVETGKLLGDGAPRLGAAQLLSITPTGLLQTLRAKALADPPRERAAALRGGYYFESAAEHYRLVFEVARKALPLPVDSVSQWLALPPAKRRAWMQQADEQVLAAMLLLEQAARRQAEVAAGDVLKRKLLVAGKTLPEQDDFHALMERAAGLLAPGSLLADSPGYGIPSADEQARLQTDTAAGAATAQRQWQTLRAAALAALPPAQRDNLAAIEANLLYLRERLRLGYGTQPGEAVTLEHRRLVQFSGEQG
ncbi:DUF4105 domain-containing protein [Stenotrophomonas terrae]|uniref:DUF7844 domain-containing protein n=1 Tax=Stenotrophomonas terrae TaxID=405446 RepID=UPI0032090601